MSQDLTIRGFSNFETPAVKEPARLAEALSALAAAMVDNEIGETFAFADVARALARPSFGP